MRYLPLTDDERQQILNLCGVKDFNDLIGAIPESLRVKGLLDLDEPMTEEDLVEHVAHLGAENKAAKMTSFLGQGVYQHSWPRVIDQITNRGEFLTAYTPYQPEISQGTLQVIFEYQSMIAELMGSEVSNASLYDGATSVVEGVLMAARLQGLKSGRVVVSEGLYSRYRSVLESYLKPLGFKFETWRADSKSFTSTEQSLPTADAEPVVAVVMQSPNTWGLIEDWNMLTSAATKLKTKSVAVVSHAHSTALFQAPGSTGVDIVTAEAQTLGIPAGFGGPHLGVICCKKKDVRQMPGRLVGATVDAKGNRAFCITLATREQHIRREKATSNICSNQNLMATRACLYLTLMGPVGMARVAQLSRDFAWHAREEIAKRLAHIAPEIKVFDGELLNEICLVAPPKQILWVDQFVSMAEKSGLLAGCRVAPPSLSGAGITLVLAFTEKHKISDLEKLLSALPSTKHA